MRQRLMILTDAPDIGGSEKFVADLVANVDPDRFEWVLAGNRHPEFDAWLSDRLGRPIQRHSVALGSYNTSLLVRGRRFLQRRRDGVATNPVEPDPELIFDPQAERLSWLKSAVTYGQMLPNLARMWWLFRKLSPDVLHINNGGYPGSRSCQLAPIAAKAANVPRVVSFVHAYAVRPNVNSRLERFLDEAVDARTDVWVTAAKGAADRLSQVRGISSERIETVYLGQPQARSQSEGARRRVLSALEIDQSCVVVFCVGILRPLKGQAYAIDALAEVLAGGRQCHLVFVGEGEDRSKLEVLVREKGLARSVSFLGFRTDVEDLLSGCDVLLSASTGFELLPYAIKEAMAHGIPAVATDVGGTSELVVDGTTGFLVPPRDPVALAEALCRLVEDAALRGRMGAAGRDRIATAFSVDEMMRQLLALYEPASAD